MSLSPPLPPSNQRGSRFSPKRIAIGVIVGLSTIVGGLVLLVSIVLFTPTRERSGFTDSSQPKGSESPAAAQVEQKIPSPPPPSPPPPPIGLGISELALTSVPLSGHWREQDILADDQQDWTGSACVISEARGRVILMTNRHCLGLDTLYLADDDGSPEVIEYSLNVHFPDGATLPVEEFGVLNSDLDIAWIAVIKKGNIRFVTLGKPMKLPGKKPGSNIVVVGSPMGLDFEGTHTFGRISAIRNFPDSLGKQVQYIQTDAAINHGNSGGPVFIQVPEERFIWAGVAVARVDNADNLGMAISADSLLDLGAHPRQRKLASI